MAKTKTARRGFSDEFKTETARLVIDGHRTVAQVCKELNLADSQVRTWMAKVRSQETLASGGLNSSEREELERLRKENRVLRTEREILKRAATFFAKENA